MFWGIIYILNICFGELHYIDYSPKHSLYIYIMNVLMNNLYKKRSVITGLEQMEWWSMF